MKKYFSIVSGLCVLSALAACNNNAPQNQAADASGAASNMGEGKAIFQQHCATCHMLDKDVTGPALGGVLTRWDNDTVRIKAFIRNPSKLIFTDKDPSAVKSFEKFKPAVMAPANLSDEQLNELVAYLQNGH